MKLELVIFGVTAFLIANTYHDGKYTKMLQISKKYFKMATFAFVGFSLYLFIKKQPAESKGLLRHANNLIKYMPVDKATADLISPLFDFTKTQESIQRLSTSSPSGALPPPPSGQMKRMLQSGGNSTKRSVSETKKKYVAAEQNWRCAGCKQQLKATFEVDHKRDLRYGGTNHVSNLEALCRDCHGNKTMVSNL